MIRDQNNRTIQALCKAPFAFTGTVKKVVFDVAPHPDGQDEDALYAHAHQARAARGINA